MTYKYLGKNRNKKRRKRGRSPRLSNLSRQAVEAEAQRIMDGEPSRLKIPL
jgi:hypothetical protein